MSRITAIDPTQATGKARELLEAVNKKLGLVLNTIRIMAHSLSVLQGYLSFSDALARGALEEGARRNRDHTRFG